jgi:hypothetical protein
LTDSGNAMELTTILNLSRDADQELCLQLNGMQLPNTCRVSYATACLQLAQEYSVAVHALINRAPDQRMVGAALALVRPGWESYIRGLWLHRCATEQQLTDYIETDAQGRTMTGMVEDIEGIKEFMNGMLLGFKSENWIAMCSLTHGGRLQTLHRVSERGIAPNYPEEVAVWAVQMTSIWSLLSAFELADMGRQYHLFPRIQAHLLAVSPPPE